MDRVIFNDSEENIKKFESYLTEIKSDVEKSLIYLSENAPVAEVVPNLPEKLQKVAEHLVQIQNTKKIIERKDITDEDFNIIRAYQKRSGLSYIDTINSLVKNAFYQMPNIKTANFFARLLMEIEKSYNRYYSEINAIPVNAIDKSLRKTLKDFRVGISSKSKIKALINVFIPEIKDTNIIDVDYTAVVKKSYLISDAEFVELAQDIKSKYCDKNGKIDNLFNNDNRKELKNLLTALKLNHLTFDEFAKKYNLNYTRCYKAPTIEGTKIMLLSYYKRKGTFRSLNTNDMYLKSKIEEAKIIENVDSIKALIEKWGFISDNEYHIEKILSAEELEARKTKVVEILEKFYPSHFIDAGITQLENRLYDEIYMLSRKFNFASVDEFLKSIGFVKNFAYNVRQVNTMFLSERDLVHYDFINGNENDDEQNEKLENQNVELLDVENGIGVYCKLAYLKKDGLGNKNSNNSNVNLFDFD